MRKRRRDGTDDGLATERHCHRCLPPLSPAATPPSSSPVFSSPSSVIRHILLSFAALCHIRWTTSYLGPLRSAPHHLRLLVGKFGAIIASFLSAITCPTSRLPTSLVTFSPLLLFALLSPYSSPQARLTTNPPPLANSLSRQSILLSSYFLLTTATSTLTAAESISQGLYLNSFIPHFEPLYYDRHQLMHQYTRLKRSLSEKEAKVARQQQQQNQQKAHTRKQTSRRRRRRDTASFLGQHVISNRSDREQQLTVNGTEFSRLELGSLNGNLSTASTTAFFRHNCPMPNHDHHLEDSTEKVLLKQSAPSPSAATLDHSTGADSWLLYDDHSDSANAEETDPDTDASIDIVEDDPEESNAAEPNLVLVSHSSSPHRQQHIRVEFTAHNRLFRLQLHSNSERVFAQNPVFETGDGKPIHYDSSNVVRGHLEDDEEATFEGIITSDGLLDGHLTTRHNEFYIEPAHRYFPFREDGNAVDFHSVIYSTSIVNFPNATHGSASPFASSKFLPLLNPFKGYAEWFQDLDQWNLMTNIEEMWHAKKASSRRRSKRASASSSESSAESFDGTTDHPVWTSFGARNQSRVNGSKDIDFEVHYKLSQKKSSSASSSSSSASSTLRIPSKAEHFRKASISSKSAAGGPSITVNGGHEHGGRYWRDMDSLHYTESEPYGIKAGNTRTHWIDDQARHHDRHVVVDPKKTTCMLYLQADHLFFEKMGSEEACIESMTRHVQKVNNIYKNTDFDQDGRPDNISFLIKRIKVHTLESLKDREYRYPQSYGVEKFLELFSEEDYDAFCLAYMFTYRDFEGGTLGLAWTGDLKNAGGVCEKNGHYRGSLKSLNTGIVTLLNYGKHVPPIVSHVTLAHEIGHNFGSPHDPEDDHACTPGGENGNYIMFARATSGDKRNNNKFSPCSLRSINAVLNTKAKSLKGCFQEPQDAICGNEVVEEGEECDCGWEEDCKEPCCFPMRANPPQDEQPCKLRPNVICSPSQGPCCTQDCKLKVGNKCRDDNGCRTSSYCNGQGPQCPPSTNKANKTICNDEYVCYMGECTGSICMAYGLESCQCKKGARDKPEKLCELCCRMPSDDSTCKSSFEWNTTPYDVPDLFSKPGTPCDNYNGYCDNNQQCHAVDPASPLATLRRLFFNPDHYSSLKRWFNEQWFYVAVLVMISVLILLMAYKVFNNRRTGGLTKTDIMEVALEAVAKHQQEQAQQQAQAQAQQSQNSSAAQSTTIGSDSVSQVSGSASNKDAKGTASSANSTASPTSSTTLNTSASSSTQSTTATSTTNNSSSVSATKTTTTALISTPSQQHNHGTGSNSTSSTNVSLQPKNSIDSQHSLLEHNNNANSYGFNSANAANSMDNSYSGSMSSYIPPQSNQSSQTVQPKVSQGYLTATASVESTASLYGTMKNTSAGQHNHPTQGSYYGTKHSAAAQSNALMSLQQQQQADANGNLYNHPFSGTGHGGSLYGYTRSQSSAVGHHHHHHHSIPSLYQPSMIYQQQPVVAPGQLAPQPFYDTSALAIVANQPTYGTTTNQGYHLPDQTYGQAYYYPASGGRQMGYHTASTYYQSSSLYDYIPFPRPVNPNAVAAAKPPPPPLPSMATHPTQVHQHQTSSSSTHKNRSIDLTGTLDTRRLYSSSLEVPGYKDSASAYYDGSTSGQTGDKGHHHHHYYYQQFYGGSGAAAGGTSSSSKFAQHYGTIHRGSATSASSLTHHNHLPNAHSSSANSSSASGTSASQASRHYQHYYPHQLHASGSSHHSTALVTSSNSRQHHSSHPQLLNTTSLSVPRASPNSGGTQAAAVEPTYGTHHSSGSSRRSHQQIYEPLATLPLSSIGQFGYPLEHSGSGHHSSNAYYSTRSDVFASHHESLPPIGALPGGGSGLHHSNSFHGHLDDFDLIGTNPRPDDAASDSNIGVSSSGHKHLKSHGSSGWV